MRYFNGRRRFETFHSSYCNIFNCNGIYKMFDHRIIQFFVNTCCSFKCFIKFRTFLIIFHRVVIKEHSYTLIFYDCYQPHFGHNMQPKVQNSYFKTLSVSVIFYKKLLCTYLSMRDGTAYSTAAQESVCCLIWSRS
jgi:hypothetical protein